MHEQGAIDRIIPLGGALPKTIEASYNQLYIKPKPIAMGEYCPTKSTYHSLNRPYLIGQKEDTKPEYWRWVVDNRRFEGIILYTTNHTPVFKEFLAQRLKEAPWCLTNERYIPKKLYDHNNKEINWCWSNAEQPEYGTKAYDTWLCKQPFDRRLVCTKIPCHTKLATSGKWSTLISMVAKKRISTDKANKIAKRCTKHTAEETWIANGGLAQAVDDYIAGSLPKLNDVK
jgi:hypothetical protein